MNPLKGKENSLSNTIQFECIHDIEECEKVWKHFNSSPENIYQDWNYIKLFYETYHYTPHFYTAYENDIPVACIALEWVPERSRLEMFGNRSYLHYLFSSKGYEYLIPLLLQQVEFSIESESLFCNKTEYGDFLQEVDTEYILDIRKIKSATEYLEKEFPGEGKDRMLQQMRKIEKLNITIENGVAQDLEWFFEMNQQNFGDMSAYHDKRRQENIKLLHASTNIHSYIRTLRLEGEIVSVYFFIKDSYNSTLYSINGATTKEISNLGKFVILDSIHLGLSLGCEYVDLGSASFGYKQNWANTTYPVYNFKK